MINVSIILQKIAQNRIYIHLNIFIIIFIIYPYCYLLSKPNQDSSNLKQIILQTPLQILRSDLDGILENPDFSNSIIGISVQNLDTGENLYSLNENKNFIPASVQKLITTAAVLEYFGKDFKFTTNLYLAGTLKANGEFVGNIIIRGSGDPTLSSYFIDNPMSILDRWAERLDSIGIKSVRGNIISDDRYFDNNYYGPGWAIDDIVYPYSSQVDALSIFDNKVDIIIKPADKPGMAAKIRTIPENSYLKIINNVKTIEQSGITDIYTIRENKENLVELYGNIISDSIKKEEYRLSVPINNPGRYFISLFKQVLEQNNIRFRGALLNIEDLSEEINYSGLQPICSHVSPNLESIIGIINKRSHNLAAEMMLKTYGKESTGQGTFNKGTESIKKFVKNVGIPIENTNIVDGSGLSRLNFISPINLLKLLNYMYRTPNKNSFISSLAQPGKDGTLKRRMTGSLAEKNIFAKTGSLNNVSTICGYIKTKNNQMIGFAIMIQNYTVTETMAQNLQDLICMRLAAFGNR